MTLDCQLPTHCCLNLIARSPGAEIRRQSQAGELFDGLMCGTIFPQTNRVVGINHDLSGFHQRRHACGITGIFNKHQERCGVWYEATVVRDTVGNRGHTKFTHAIVDVVSCMILLKRSGAFPDGQVAGRKIR